MGPNELLYWLSARRHGSWQQFRGAVEELGVDQSADLEFYGERFPLHQRLRFNFQSLGHVEFNALECGDGWRVTPPALALTSQADRTVGVLSGARLPTLLDRFLGEASGFSPERHAVSEAPDVIVVCASEPARLIELAQRCGLWCQPDAPINLLARLPPITDGTWRTPAPLPFGKNRTVERFEPLGNSGRWRESSEDEANQSRTGLFRFTRFQNPEYYLRADGETFRVPGPVGKYYILRRARETVLRYDVSRCSLAVPAICRPPVLVERALVLCSGFLPAYDRQHGTVTYRDVGEPVVRLASHCLCSRITYGQPSSYIRDPARRVLALSEQPVRPAVS